MSLSWEMRWFGSEPSGHNERLADIEREYLHLLYDSSESDEAFLKHLPERLRDMAKRNGVSAFLENIR